MPGKPIFCDACEAATVDRADKQAKGRRGASNGFAALQIDSGGEDESENEVDVSPPPTDSDEMPSRMKAALERQAEDQQATTTKALKKVRQKNSKATSS